MAAVMFYQFEDQDLIDMSLNLRKLVRASLKKKVLFFLPLDAPRVKAVLFRKCTIPEDMRLLCDEGDRLCGTVCCSAIVFFQASRHVLVFEEVHYDTSTGEVMLWSDPTFKIIY